jgi:hypothetical protein
VLARLPFICNGNQILQSPENLAKLTRIYPAIVVAATTAIYGFICFARRNPLRDVALLLIWMTLASPRAWTFNFAVEVLAALLLAAAILDRRPRSWLAMVALLAAPAALIFPTNLIRFSDHWTLAAYILQNKHFDAACIMIVALISIDHRETFPRVKDSCILPGL